MTTNNNFITRKELVNDIISSTIQYDYDDESNNNVYYDMIKKFMSYDDESFIKLTNLPLLTIRKNLYCIV